MKSFIAKYLYLLIWIAAIVVIGFLFAYVVELNSHLVSIPIPPETPPVVVPAAPTPPPAPSISLTLQKTGKNKNSLYIQWQNLPINTTALKIYRGKTGSSSSTWSLWKTLGIPQGENSNGSAQIDLGTANESGYSFYVQAVTQNGTSTSTSGGGGGGDVLWTSGVTVPGTGTPTSTTQGTTGQQTTSTSTTQNTSTTNQNQNQQTTSTTQSTGTNTPSGTPYYNPQVQLSGYGNAPSGNFWVQHIDLKIQIGWQDLPSNSTSFIVYRSPNQDGPWTTVLTQENPGTSGSIQIVDDTLHAPYYYEMYDQNGSTTIAIYGPAYLSAQ